MAAEKEIFKQKETEASEEATEICEKIKVRLATYGSETKEMEVNEGTTLGDVLKSVPRQQDQGVRVDGKVVKNDHIMRDGELITVLPRAIRGGVYEGPRA